MMDPDCKPWPRECAESASGDNMGHYGAKREVRGAMNKLNMTTTRCITVRRTKCVGYQKRKLL
ncbi:hypothetical protein [Paenibacillus lemnae]|uniref:hypothetical protein n=1 Tax=Paenibacillus lemnae TaxID=1330551 RepID=UPI00146E9E38|nr:hypothetical protein [Paenibacillus lemnae]